MDHAAQRSQSTDSLDYGTHVTADKQDMTTLESGPNAPFWNQPQSSCSMQLHAGRGEARHGEVGARSPYAHAYTITAHKGCHGDQDSPGEAINNQPWHLKHLHQHLLARAARRRQAHCGPEAPCGGGRCQSGFRRSLPGEPLENASKHTPIAPLPAVNLDLPPSAAGLAVAVG